MEFVNFHTHKLHANPSAKNFSVACKINHVEIDYNIQNYMQCGECVICRGSSTRAMKSMRNHFHNDVMCVVCRLISIDILAMKCQANL